MRRLLPILALLACSPASADSGFMEWPTLQGAGKKRPVFSFTAPAAGAYATLTASTGQTITCTRAAPSNATYQTGTASLAYAAANTCRVDYRGLLVEESRINIEPQSAALATTPWVVAHGSTATGIADPGAIVVTANNATAPDGTLAADSMSVPAVQCAPDAGITYSVDNSSITGVATNAAFAWSSWMSLTSGSSPATFYLHLTDNAVGPVTGGNRSVQLSTGAWTYKSWTATSNTSTKLSFSYGPICQDGDATGTTVPAMTVAGWGAQVEQGAFATSYIPTTTVAVTRSADVVDVGAVTLPATYSLSATVNPEGLSGTETSLYLTDGTHTRSLAVDSSGHAVCTYGATSDSTTSTLAAGTATKIACKYDGAKVYACLAGACTAGTAAASDGATAMTHLYVGSNGSANFANSYLSALCAGRSGACLP